MMEPGLRDLADGIRHIYFEMQDQRAATPEEQRWIRDLVRQGLKRVRRYGNFCCGRGLVIGCFCSVRDFIGNY
ncbi:MAG: hypothetical protein V8Q27_03670 [Eubacteriales bacterium]